MSIYSILGGPQDQNESNPPSSSSQQPSQPSIANPPANASPQARPQHSATTSPVATHSAPNTVLTTSPLLQRPQTSSLGTPSLPSISAGQLPPLPGSQPLPRPSILNDSSKGNIPSFNFPEMEYTRRKRLEQETAQTQGQQQSGPSPSLLKKLAEPMGTPREESQGLPAQSPPNQHHQLQNPSQQKSPVDERHHHHHHPHHFHHHHIISQEPALDSPNASGQVPAPLSRSPPNHTTTPIPPTNANSESTSSSKPSGTLSSPYNEQSANLAPPFASAPLHKYQQQQQAGSGIEPHHHHHHNHSHNHEHGVGHTHGVHHSHFIEPSSPSSNTIPPGQPGHQPNDLGPNASQPPQGAGIQASMGAIARDVRDVSAGPASMGIHTHHLHTHTVEGLPAPGGMSPENHNHNHVHDPQSRTFIGYHDINGVPSGPGSNLITSGESALGSNGLYDPSLHPYFYVSSDEKLFVGSHQVYESVKHFPRYNLGSMVYILEDFKNIPNRTTTSSNNSIMPLAGEGAPNAGDIYNLEDGSVRVDANSPLIPRFDGKENSIFQVRIPRKYLSRQTNPNVDQERRVWGTDVYTDDSDLVAVLYHMGILPWKTAEERKNEQKLLEDQKEDPKDEKEKSDEEDDSIKRSDQASLEEKKSEGSTESKESKEEPTKSDKKEEDVTQPLKKPSKPQRKLNYKLLESLEGYKRPFESISVYGSSPKKDGAEEEEERGLESYGDLVITLIILPRLLRYSGSFRNGIFSRDWGVPRVPHDGVSYAIADTRFVEPGHISEITSGKRARVDKWGSEFKNVFADVIEKRHCKVGDNEDKDEGVKRAEVEWMLSGFAYPKFKPTRKKPAEKVA